MNTHPNPMVITGHGHMNNTKTKSEVYKKIWMNVYDLLDEYEELIKELQKDIKDLERRKRDK